jgi:non-ribosomal peptide synthetase component F
MADYSARIAALSPEKLETLLERIKEKQTIKPRPGAALPQIQPNPNQRHLPFPLTDVQKAYWVGRSGLFDLGSCANVYLEYEISFQLGQEKRFSWRSILGWLGRKYVERKIVSFFINRLNLALQRLIERHDMLRAIVLPDGQQMILPQVPAYQVEVIDLRQQPSHRVETELKKTRERLRYARASGETWPLFEFVVCPLSGQRIRLLIRVDPLIIDGESRGRLIAELGQLLMNPQADLSSLFCTYRDYAVTWTAFQEDELYQRSRDYWLALLPEMPFSPRLPQVQNTSPLTRPRFEFLSRELLEPQAWRRLKARAARLGLSPSGIALTAFVEVLAVWSQESSFTIGLVGTYHPPVHPQIQDVFGNFNSLALFSARGWRGTFKDRAESLWRQLIEDLDHRYFSGHQVLREWNRMQTPSTKASVPIHFNSVIEKSQSNHPSRRHLEELGSEIGSDGPFRLESIEVGAYFPQEFLSPVLQEDNGALSCKWQIAEGIFPPGMVQDMLDAYQRLLLRLANDETSWHQTTRRLVPSEQLAQRAAFNATEAPLSREMLHTLFAAQASQRPSEIAVVTAARNLTYEALYCRANQIGHYLRELGAVPSDLIAIVMEPGWEQVVAAMGVLFSGAAYLPIQSHLSGDYLARLVAYGDVQWVLTQSHLDQNLEWPEGVMRFCVDDDDVWAGVDNGALASIQSPTDLACMFYTLDSSEQPRGIMLSHQGIVNTILDVNRRWNVGPDDRVLALSSLDFDLSLYDIFGVLAAGGTIIFPGALATWEPARWVQLIRQHCATIWNSSPTLLGMLLDYLVENPDMKPLPLRLVLQSWDRISANWPDRFKVLRDAQVVELIGFTQTSIWSGFRVFETNDAIPQRHSGFRPLMNQRLYVLDALLEPRPVWVPGQLYVGGQGLTCGYWKDANKSQTQFVQHPQTGERLYCTGKLGRFLPDGTLEFLGWEKDFQTLVQGHWVEIEQIQSILEQHPAVRNCIVLVHKDTLCHETLVAYVVLYRGQASTAEELRDFVKEKAPDYMAPTAFVFLSSMPLTPAGQIDLDALIPPEDNASKTAGNIAPQDALECQLAEVWETLLETTPVGITDNFFDLGGDSFKVTCLMNQIRDKFGIEQPLYSFFYDPTIKFLANTIRQQLDLDD